MENTVFADINIEIPNHISELSQQLEDNGFEAYLIGGCVRDAVMGREQNDFDMATDATPEEMLKVFCNYRVITTGLKHGTVTVVVDNENVELTTYRIDGEYLDSRHPENVSFTRDLREDTARRDFTVNAMAYNKREGVVDFYGGLEDIKNKRIKAVGNADKRFKEDALRILRALRFASSLGFNIEGNTAKAVRKNAKLLKKVSAERIIAELKKLFSGEKARAVLLEYADVLLEASFELFENCRERISKISRLPKSYLVCFAILMEGMNTNKAREVLTSLCLSNAEKKRILTLLDLTGREFPQNKRELKILISETDKDVFEDYFDYYRAKGENIESLYKAYVEVCENKECCSIKDLRVNGNDITDWGLASGKQVGNALNLLLTAVINEKVENERAALLEFLRGNFN